MRLAMFALSATAALATALAAEAVFDSRAAGALAFATLFVLLVSGRLAHHD